MNDVVIYPPEYEVSLFSGAGGGLLATQHLLGWRTVCYVEIEEYPVRVLRARIRDGLLNDAPVWNDVRSFTKRNNGCRRFIRELRRIRGRLVVTAGFPCQPFSVAGDMRAEDDPRNMWPHTIRVVREIRPGWVFLENVPGLLSKSHGYFGQILGELSESGYDARWSIVSAAEMGAPHKRDRLWVVAYDREKRVQGGRGEEIQGKQRIPWGKDVRGFEDWRERPDIPPFLFRRMGDGVARYMDRIRAIGEGQVPVVVEEAWLRLTKDFRNE